MRRLPKNARLAAAGNLLSVYEALDAGLENFEPNSPAHSAAATWKPRFERTLQHGGITIHEFDLVFATEDIIAILILGAQPTAAVDLAGIAGRLFTTTLQPAQEAVERWTDQCLGSLSNPRHH